MELFVKTSALGQTGIHWRKIVSEENQPEETPSIIKQKVVQRENGQFFIVNDLVDEYRPSLLIFRGEEAGQKKLLVEVFGIESHTRSNQMGRRVLNAIAWIFDDNDENEKLARQIAYTIIQGILEKDSKINNLIENEIYFHEKEEFRVYLNKFQEFINSVKSLKVSNEQIPNNIEQSKIENRSDQTLEDLAEDLKKYQFLKRDGVLVVVTENLEIKTILHDAGVWRGFANKVEEPIARGVDDSSQKKNIQFHQNLQKVSNHTQIPNLLIGIIILILVLIALLVISWL
jgi:hypothetical protein